jgi:hypothetical protein
MLVNLLSHIERFINDSIFYIVFKEHKRFYLAVFSQN